MKELKTLPEDIYALFNPDEDHVLNEDNLEEFAQSLKQVMRTRLAKYVPPVSPLRFSSLGKPDRQLWYDAHPEEGTKEPIRPNTYIKFLFGDILEQLLVLLTKEAGHTVEDLQGKVSCGDVSGSLDAVVDGVVVDFKSASPYGYTKFKNRTVTEDDPFGYVQQLSGYASCKTPGKDAAWIAIDKVGGDICVSPLPYTVMKHYQPLPRIEHLKEVIANAEPPDRCYEDIPDGKSGNRKLGTGCSYCSHAGRCWPGLRKFIYSTGPRYLTKVDRVPDVPEFNV